MKSDPAKACLVHHQVRGILSAHNTGGSGTIAGRLPAEIWDAIGDQFDTTEQIGHIRETSKGMNALARAMKKPMQTYINALAQACLRVLVQGLASDIPIEKHERYQSWMIWAPHATAIDLSRSGLRLNLLYVYGSQDRQLKGDAECGAFAGLLAQVGQLRNLIVSDQPNLLDKTLQALLRQCSVGSALAQLRHLDLSGGWASDLVVGYLHSCGASQLENLRLGEGEQTGLFLTRQGLNELVDVVGRQRNLRYFSVSVRLLRAEQKPPAHVNATALFVTDMPMLKALNMNLGPCCFADDLAGLEHLSGLEHLTVASHVGNPLPRLVAAAARWPASLLHIKVQAEGWRLANGAWAPGADADATATTMFRQQMVAELTGNWQNSMDGQWFCLDREPTAAG